MNQRWITAFYRLLQMPECGVQFASFGVVHCQLDGWKGFRLTGGSLKEEPHHGGTSSCGVGSLQRFEGRSRDAVQFRVLDVLGHVPVEIALLEVSTGKMFPCMRVPGIEFQSLVGLTAVSTRPDPNTIQGEVKREDGSIVGGGTYVVSADGKSLTVTNSGIDSQLRPFQQRTVWDRQEPAGS